jgi:hypothetical protein
LQISCFLPLALALLVLLGVAYSFCPETFLLLLERHDVMKSSYGAGGGERRGQSPVSMLFSFTLFFVPLRGIATPAVRTGFPHDI